MGKHRKNKDERDEGRDISEKIALGMLKSTGTLSGDAVYDSRLFNQSSGISSGFGAEDDYSVYSKPLFNRTEGGIHYLLTHSLTYSLTYSLTHSLRC